MTRVLLLDTSFAARPVHDWLRGQGYEVWTIGNRPGDILAVRDPERYLQDNYADVDAVQAHVDRLKISHVVPGCTDISIETALRLRNIAEVLDSPDTYHTLADKAAFRALCARLDLPAPRRVDPEELPVAGKLIAKPADAFSGRGIAVFDGADRAGALKALEAARCESRTGEALIETYTEGQLLSYHVFIEDRRTVDGVFVVEHGSVTPYAVDTSHVIWDFPAAGEAALRDALDTAAQALGLVDGLLHVQFIWDGDTPWLIELSRRCPGDLYPRLAELSTGWPYFARYASYFVERPVGFDGIPMLRRHILRHTVTASHEHYEGIWMADPLPIVEFHPLAPVGRTPPSPDRIDRVALLFAEYAAREDLERARELFRARHFYDSHSVNK